jgi:hypothetical protein
MATGSDAGSATTPASVLKGVPKKVPSNIAKWGYAALFLFAVAASVVSFVSANQIPLLFITAILVFGFAVALYAFDRMIRSTVRIWQLAGTVLALLAIGIVLAAFAASVYFLIMKPAYFRKMIGLPEVALAPVVDISSQVLSTSKVRLSWRPLPGPSQVLIRIHLVGGQEVASISVSANSGARDINELLPQKNYRFDLFHITEDGTSSAAQTLAWTDADKMQVTSKSSPRYVYLYSGALSQKTGLPADQSTPIEAFIGETLRYVGGILNGELHGFARLSALDGSAECTARFDEGTPNFEICNLPLKPKGGASSPNWERLGPARYSGNVRAATSSDSGRTEAIGPFAVVMHGSGRVVGSGGYSEEGKFNAGHLDTGVTLNDRASFGLVSSYDLKNAARIGWFIEYSDSSARIGYQANGEQNFGVAVNAMPNGKRKSVGVETYGEGNGSRFSNVNLDVGNDCENIDYLTAKTVVEGEFLRTTFADSKTGTLRFGEWSTGCYGRSEEGLECSIEAAGIKIVAKKKAMSIPKFAVELPYSHLAEHQIRIGERTFEGDGVGLNINKAAPMAAAAMCQSGLTAVNKVSGKSVSTDGFCRGFGTMLSRLYVCA